MTKKNNQSEQLLDYIDHLQKQLALCWKCKKWTKEMIEAGTPSAPEYEHLLAKLANINADLNCKLDAAQLQLQMKQRGEEVTP